MSWTCHAATQSLATIKVQPACTVCTVCTVSFHLSVNVRVVVSRLRIFHTGTVLCREASHRPKHLNRARQAANIVTTQSCLRCASVVQRARATWARIGGAGCDAIFLPVLRAIRGSTAPADTNSKFGHPLTSSFAALRHLCIMRARSCIPASTASRALSKPV